MPKVEKIYTLSGAAVNLKYKVCNKIAAATNLIIHINIFIKKLLNSYIKSSSFIILKMLVSQLNYIFYIKKSPDKNRDFLNSI